VCLCVVLYSHCISEGSYSTTSSSFRLEIIVDSNIAPITGMLMCQREWRMNFSGNLPVTIRFTQNMIGPVIRVLAKYSSSLLKSSPQYNDPEIASTVRVGASKESQNWPKPFRIHIMSSRTSAQNETGLSYREDKKWLSLLTICVRRPLLPLNYKQDCVEIEVDETIFSETVWKIPEYGQHWDSQHCVCEWRKSINNICDGIFLLSSAFDSISSVLGL